MSAEPVNDPKYYSYDPNPDSVSEEDLFLSLKYQKTPPEEVFPEELRQRYVKYLSAD